MLKKFCTSVLLATFFLTASCGYLFKPERINKSHSGQLDIGILILDSLGLLLFIIPGAVALAVDFSTGTIYLPKGKRRISDMSASSIQDVLVKNGYNVSLSDVEKALISAQS